MSLTMSDAKLREVLHQVIEDPAYQDIKRVPFIAWQQLGLVLLSYGLCFMGIYLAAHGWSLWLCYPLIIFGIYTSFTPLHDATHQAVSSHKGLNDFLGTLSGNLLFPFVSTAMYRYFHLSHHRFVGDPALDPDESMVGIPTKYFPIGYIAFFIYEYFIFKWLFTSVWHRTPVVTKRIIVGTLAANIIFYLIIFTSPIAFEFLIWFYIPNRIAVAYTTYTFAHLPHPEGVHIHDHPFQATYTLTGPSMVLRHLWGQADHAIHHLLPHIPWYNYNKIWALANGILQGQSIPERAIYAAPDRNFKEKYLQNDVDKGASLHVTVEQIVSITKEIKQFTLRAADGTSLPPYTAGSHIQVTLPSGRIRSYSLINNPTDHSSYNIAVKREINGRGGSAELHDTISIGDTIQISHPKNNFLLYENASRYILIAGGIGITPLLAMAKRLVDLEKRFEFHVCVRDEKSIPFREVLTHSRLAPYIDIHLDDDGRSGIELDSVLSNSDSDTLLYVCGPPAFNEWIKETALNRQWQTHQIKTEAFSSNRSQSVEDKPFDVVLQKSNKRIHVSQHETILDALQMHNVHVPYSCLQGTCGTCITPVISGEITHRDIVLSEEERRCGHKICPCVSRAKDEELVLDL